MASLSLLVHDMSISVACWQPKYFLNILITIMHLTLSFNIDHEILSSEGKGRFNQQLYIAMST